MSKPHKKIKNYNIREFLASHLSSKGAVIVSKHCRQRMQERGILRDELDDVLRGGEVTNVEFHRETDPKLWRYRMRAEIDGRDLEVIFQFEVDNFDQTILTLVTCYSKD